MTYRDFFEEAKRKGYVWADAAIANTGEHVDLETDEEYLPEALAVAFRWGKTNEGFEFWEAICRILYAISVKELEISALAEKTNDLARKVL